MNFSKPLPTYVINLEHRTDRKEHILAEFKNKFEFNLKIVSAIRNSFGALGYWDTLTKIIKDNQDGIDECILVCQDDHTFTHSYSPTELFLNIEKANSLEADLLIGGVSWFQTTFSVDSNLMWVGDFHGGQFLIVFRRFFQRILSTNLNGFDAADYRLSCLTEQKFVIHPFISIQKEFGYSDITSKNNNWGIVPRLFKDSADAMAYILAGEKGYRLNSTEKTPFLSPERCLEITIPTYIMSDDTDDIQGISKEFEGRGEFELSMVSIDNINEKLPEQKIAEIVAKAIENEDDIIIICGIDHRFTKEYNKLTFINSIVEANWRGADILAGGISGAFDHILPLSEKLLWANSILPSSFLVIFSRFYKHLLEIQLASIVNLFQKTCLFSGNKMVTIPYISTDSLYLKRSEHQEQTNESLETIEKVYRNHYKLSKFAKIK